MACEREADLRYAGQQWDVRVSGDFESEYERLFGHLQPDGAVEITEPRVVGIGRLPALTRLAAPAADAPPELRARRPVYMGEEAGFVDTAVYAGDDLRHSHGLRGPLLVEKATTTIVAGSGDTLEVPASGDYLIRFAPS